MRIYKNEAGEDCIDLRDMDPKMVDIMTHTGSGSRQKDRYKDMTYEERLEVTKGFHTPEAREKSGRASRELWANKPPEQIERHIRSSFLSPKAIETSHKSSSESFKKMSLEDYKAYCEKHRKCSQAFWDSSRGALAKGVIAYKSSKAWENCTLEEKARWLEVSFHDPSIRARAGRNAGLSCSKFWSNLTREEVFNRLSNSVLKPEARLKIVKSNKFGPTMPEYFLGLYLESNFPGQWLYNGGGEQSLVVGNCIPDFVSEDGSSIIEVFGPYWHSYGSEEAKITHHEASGYKTLVLWQDECYDEALVIEKVKELLNKREVETIK